MYKMEKGIEQSLLKHSKTAIPKKSGAKYGALDYKNDADLTLVLKAWPTLPEQIKAAIRTLIQTHKAGEK